MNENLAIITTDNINIHDIDFNIVYRGRPKKILVFKITDFDFNNDLLAWIKYLKMFTNFFQQRFKIKKKQISQIKIPTYSFQDYLDEDPDIIEQKVLNLYSELTKNYEDDFTYQGLKLFFIFRHKIIYFLSFLLFFQNSFSNFIKREKITKVLYLGLSDISKHIFMDICRKNNIGYQKFHSYKLSVANFSSILHHKSLYYILIPLLLNT